MTEGRVLAPARQGARDTYQVGDMVVLYDGYRALIVSRVETRPGTRTRYVCSPHMGPNDGSGSVATATDMRPATPQECDMFVDLHLSYARGEAFRLEAEHRAAIELEQQLRRVAAILEQYGVPKTAPMWRDLAKNPVGLRALCDEIISSSS